MTVQEQVYSRVKEIIEAKHASRKFPEHALIIEIEFKNVSAGRRILQELVEGGYLIKSRTINYDCWFLTEKEFSTAL